MTCNNPVRLFEKCDSFIFSSSRGASDGAPHGAMEAALAVQFMKEE
jgi:hypothetical protein